MHGRDEEHLTCSHICRRNTACSTSMIARNKHNSRSQRRVDCLLWQQITACTFTFSPEISGVIFELLQCFASHSITNSMIAHDICILSLTTTSKRTFNGLYAHKMGRSLFTMNTNWGVHRMRLCHI